MELRERFKAQVSGSRLQALEIHLPTEEDRAELHALFTEVIRSNFEREGLGADHPAVPDLIAEKRILLNKVLSGDRQEGHFYVLRWAGKIVATIEWGPPGHLIRELSEGRYAETMEIGTVFILPTYQRRGIGKILLTLAEEDLKRCGHRSYVLDSGYGYAQVYWKQRLGEPAVIIPGYWGEDAPHMIWHGTIEGA